MICDVLDKISREKDMEFSTDFRKLMEYVGNYIFRFAFCEINVQGRVFIFNNFLGETGKLNTDLYQWNKFNGGTGDFLIFGNGVYGESFMIKSKGSDIGKVYVETDSDGERERILIADSFTTFLKNLNSNN